MSKENKKINEVLREARVKIKDQLDNTAKVSKTILEKSQEQGKELGDKVNQAAKDTKTIIKENGDNLLGLLSFMLIL